MSKLLSDIDGTTKTSVEYAYVTQVTGITPNEPVSVVVPAPTDEDPEATATETHYRVRVSAAFELLDGEKNVLRDGLIRTAYGPASSTQRTLPEVMEWVGIIASVGTLKWKAEFAGHEGSAQMLAGLLATNKQATEVVLA